MAKQLDLEFVHQADVEIVSKTYWKDLQEHAKEHGLKAQRVSPQEFTLTDRGVDLTTIINGDSLVIRGKVGLPASLFFGRIKSELEEGMPKLLKRCETAKK